MTQIKLSKKYIINRLKKIDHLNFLFQNEYCCKIYFAVNCVFFPQINVPAIVHVSILHYRNIHFKGNGFNFIFRY